MLASFFSKRFPLFVMMLTSFQLFQLVHASGETDSVAENSVWTSHFAAALTRVHAPDDLVTNLSLDAKDQESLKKEISALPSDAFQELKVSQPNPEELVLEGVGPRVSIGFSQMNQGFLLIGKSKIKFEDYKTYGNYKGEVEMALSRHSTSLENSMFQKWLGHYAWAQKKNKASVPLAASVATSAAQAQKSSKKKPDLADQIISKYHSDARASQKAYQKIGVRAFVTEGFTCQKGKFLDISTTLAAYENSGATYKLPLPHASLMAQDDGTFNFDYVCCGKGKVNSKGILTSLTPHEKGSDEKKCPIANFNKKIKCPKVGAAIANSPPFFGMIKTAQACCADSHPQTGCYARVAGPYMELKNSVKLGTGTLPSPNQNTKSAQ